MPNAPPAPAATDPPGWLLHRLSQQSADEMVRTWAAKLLQEGNSAKKRRPKTCAGQKPITAFVDFDLDGPDQT